MIIETDLFGCYPSPVSEYFKKKVIHFKSFSRTNIPSQQLHIKAEFRYITVLQFLRAG